MGFGRSDGLFPDPGIYRLTGGDKRGDNRVSPSGEAEETRSIPGFVPGLVPIPDAVLNEGFLEYVAGLPAGPLFPKLPLYKGRRNKYASNIVSRWLRQLGFSGRKSFHSWRKTVRTQLENNGVSGDRARFIIGHGAKDVDARHYQEHSIQKLQPILNNLWS